jgi:hypothetical protein
MSIDMLAVRVSIVLFVALLIVIAAKKSLGAEVLSDTPVSITGKLSPGKNGTVCITNGDTIVPNPTVHSVSERQKVVRIPIGSDNLESPKYRALREQAARGKTVTLRGEFHGLHGHGPDFYGSLVAFFWEG